MPIRKTHGSISSTDSGHSDAMSYCETSQNVVYHLQSTMAAPLPPRRHSAVQQGSNNNTSNNINNNTNLYQLIQPNSVNTSSSTKQANGDLSMPPPPNPRSRPPPFPIGIPVLPNPNMNVGTNVAGYNIYASQPQFQQMRHTGKINFIFIILRLEFLKLISY